MVIMGPSYYVAPPKQQLLSPQKVFLGGIGLVIALVLGALMLSASSGQPSNTALLQRTSLRLSALNAFLDQPAITRNLKNEALSQIALNASITLTSDQNSLDTLLPETKLSASMIAEETDTTTEAKIEQAQLDGKLDAVYREAYLIKIKALRALLAETAPKTAAQETRKVLINIDEYLADQQKELEKLTL
jgi:hypothetical protein